MLKGQPCPRSAEQAVIAWDLGPNIVSVKFEVPGTLPVVYVKSAPAPGVKKREGHK